MQEEKYYSRYLTPVIDGKMTEWGDTLSYDNSTKCIYTVANDNTALYILIKATDRFQQIKMIQGGMQIWIDDKVKKNKSLGVKFPVGGGDLAMPTDRTGGQDPKEMRQQMKLKLLRMELTGFKEGFNGPQSIYSTVQVKPVIDWDDKENMIYELAIPFAALEESVRTDLNNISIGVFINGLKMEQAPGGEMPGGSRVGGRPGGGPPGSTRPGADRRMPDQNQMENMSKEESFWTKYTISKN
jgi:hypothetical protein